MGAINKVLLEQVLECSTQTWQPELSLLARHNVYFYTRLADCPSITEAAHQLRYQVYCLERRFENPDEHSGGLETDQYDSHAIQGVLYHRPTDRPIGTVRMILPADCASGRLPIEQFLHGNGINLSDIVDIERSVEVSRFAISKEFRRRWTDDLMVASHPLGPQDAARQSNLAFLSLVQFFLRQSIERRVLYWTAVMEPMLLRMLDRMGIHFRPIGPVVNHHGLRQPSWSYIPTVLDELKLEHRDYWEVVTNGGELSEKMALLAPTPIAIRARA
jgi:N-acyl amino acid synthase of PEP-CTERM/exosortase system